MSPRTDDLRNRVRDRYAAAATAAINGTSATCCGVSADGEAQEMGISGGFGAELYTGEDRDSLPADALAASLGCGNPLAVAELNDGETVLDLGSGGGIDVLLSARRVGPTGTVYGVDITDEMLTLARANAVKAGASNVEFIKGTMEAVPLADESIDVVISNCVINLSTDKAAVLAEAHRLLRPGGRFGVSDVVADDHLDAAQRAERGSYVGCVAGALSIGEYRDGLTAAGFTDISITLTHHVADGMHSAIVRARKPGSDACCGVTACCTPTEQAVDRTTTIGASEIAGGCGCVS
ncbi:MAG: arsenite methyltransferase [Pseudonocardia sp.]|nr:arsenite methyltransferase [Pseudonocardia sp.]